MPWEILFDSFLKFNESNFSAIWVVKIWIFRKRNSFWTFVALLSRLSNGSCLVCRVKAFSWEKLASFRWILRQSWLQNHQQLVLSWERTTTESEEPHPVHNKSKKSQQDCQWFGFWNLVSKFNYEWFRFSAWFVYSKVVGSHSHNHAMSRCPPTA